MKTIHNKSISIYLIAGILLINLLPRAYAQNNCEEEKLIRYEKGVEYSESITPVFYTPPEVTWDNGFDSTQFRIVYFVHGLAGNSSSLGTMAESLASTHKIIPVTPNYSGNNLTEAAIDLNNSMHALSDNINIILNQPNPSRNFTIAHSQGGIISRSLLAYYDSLNLPLEERLYGGLVTLGTPHLGSKLINHMPELITYIGTSAAALIAGPLWENVHEHWLSGLIVSATISQDGIEAYGSAAAVRLIPLGFDDYLSPLLPKYAFNSPAINQLNAHLSEIPVVAMAGIEDQPVLWRTLHSLRNDPNDQPAFTADDDAGFITEANTNYAFYDAKYIAYSELYDHLSTAPCSFIQWLISPLYCSGLTIWDDILNLDNVFGLGEDDAKQIRDGYFEGREWWINANNSFRYLIGAYGDQESISETHYVCRCSYKPLHITINTTLPIGEPCTHEILWNNCNEYPLLITNFTNQPSDGIVLTESAYGPSDNIHFYPVTLQGSNHQQMKNDSKVGIELNNLLNGNFGNYFKTNELQN